MFKRVRRESPAAYLKVCAMLVPREMKVERSGGVKDLTDEQLERAIEVIQAMIDDRMVDVTPTPEKAHAICRPRGGA